MESYLIISKLTKGFTSNYFPDDNNNYYIAYYPRSIINNVFYHTQYNNIINWQISFKFELRLSSKS